MLLLVILFGKKTCLQMQPPSPHQSEEAATLFGTEGGSTGQRTGGVSEAAAQSPRTGSQNTGQNRSSQDFRRR